MGQKVNPISLRIQQTNRSFDSSWYSENFYSQLILKDLQIQNYLNSFLNIIKRPNARFIVQNSQKKTKIFLFLCNPIIIRTTRSKFFRLQLEKKRKASQTTLNLGDNLYAMLSMLPMLPMRSKDSKDSKAVKLPTVSTIFMPFSSVHLRCKTKGETTNDGKSLPKRDSKQAFSKKHFVQQEPLWLHQRSTNGLFNAFESKLFFFLFSKNEKVIKKTINNLEKRNTFLEAKDASSHLMTSSLDNLNVTCTKGATMIPMQSKDHKQGLSNERDSLFLGLKIAFMFPKKVGRLLAEPRKTKELNFLETKINRDIDHLNNRFYLRYFILLSFFFKSIFKDINYKRVVKVFFRFAFLQKKTRTFLTKEYLIKNNFFNNSPQTSFEQTSFEENRLDKKNLLNINEINLLHKFNSRKELPFSLIKNFKSLNYLESFLSKQTNTNVELISTTILQDWQSAIYFVNEIVYFLERRVKFRTIKNILFREIANNTHIKGIRITCSGRTGGKSKKAQRSKIESIKYGETSLHVFSSKIDFKSKNAETPYGLVGIKVWICYR